jgi:diaminopimelate decarboxylase
MEIGFENRKIMFAGVGKTDQEIDFALEKESFALTANQLLKLK